MVGRGNKQIDKSHTECSKEVYEMEKDKDLQKFLRSEEREEKAKEKKEKFPKGEQVITDYKIALADPEVDAVFVLTPNYKHYNTKAKTFSTFC